ncbi:MAG: DndE family protein [Cytophagales bacterium]|nr:DndE family protein [Cytophagales bacterium]
MLKLPHIRTSKENKSRVASLTHRLKFRAENIVARISLAYSLEQGVKLKLSELQDSGGKEYSPIVLFSDHEPYYIGWVCCLYQIHSKDERIPKYLKLHLDDGIILIEEALNANSDEDPIRVLMEQTL